MERHNGYGNHALITGASSGIGREIAKALAAEGYRPVLVGRHGNTLEAVAREIRAERAIEATICPADLGQPETPQLIFDQLRERETAGGAGCDA